MPCDTCNRPDESAPVIGVASSGLGPISFGYCRECADCGAEPLMMFKMLYHDMSGDIKALATWVLDMKTWVDGKYVPILEWWSEEQWVWFTPDPMYQPWMFHPEGPLPIPPEYEEYFNPKPSTEKFDDFDCPELQ